MDARLIHAKGTFDRTMFATITGVNTKAGTVSIIFNDQFGVRDDVPLPVVSMSRNAWIRFMPQINDVVHVGIRGDDSAVILGWHPWSYKARTEGFDAEDLNQAGGPGAEMMQELKPGEIDMRGAGGAYLRFSNNGDLILMGLSGRLQFYGIESLVEQSQNAYKVTDGQSWFRFGHVYRLFAGVSERELPTVGTGSPNSGPTPYRERDTRLLNAAGQLQVQDSMGDVIDANGVQELSGTTGAGSTNKPSVSNVGDSATAFFKGSIASVRGTLSNALSEAVDQVVGFATEQIDSIKTSINAVVTGIGSADGISSTPADLDGIISGEGTIAGDAGDLDGIGTVGQPLRRRLLINKNGEQVYAHDIDDEGCSVTSSQSDKGIRINANKGALIMFAEKGLEMLAKAVIYVADNISETAKEDIKQIAGGKIRRIAGTDIKDNANTISRTANTTIADRAGTSITQQSDGSITITASTGLTASSSTTITISATGIVTITGAIVNIN